MNQGLVIALAIAAGVGLVFQNWLMVRITLSSSTILVAMLLNAVVGITLISSLLLGKEGVSGIKAAFTNLHWWMLIPGLLGTFFVFASISGYRYLGAAATISLLVASQLIGGLVMDIVRSDEVDLSRLIAPIAGAVLLVIGTWLVAQG